MIEFGGLSLTEAAHKIVFEELEEDVGGLIAIDRNGTITMPFNTGGMFRGEVKQHSSPHVWVWKDEENQMK